MRAPEETSRARCLLAGWREHWFAPAPLADLAIARVLLVVIVLYLDGSIRFLNVARAPASTWQPIPLIDFLGIGQPSWEQLRWLRDATRLALLAAGLGIFTNVALACALALQLLQEGLLNCFGKVTHSTIPLLHAMLFFALAPCGAVLSVDAWRRRWRARRRKDAGAAGQARLSRFARWPFELLFIELAFYYFDAGLSKLSSSGLAWADGQTLQFHLIKYPSAAGLWVASSVWLCAALSAGALLFEVGFPLAIVIRRLRPYFLAAGVCFHLANQALLDLIFWPVLAVYPLVVPWSEVARWLRGKGQGPAGAGAASPGDFGREIEGSSARR